MTSDHDLIFRIVKSGVPSAPHARIVKGRSYRNYYKDAFNIEDLKRNIDWNSAVENNNVDSAVLI